MSGERESDGVNGPLIVDNVEILIRAAIDGDGKRLPPFGLLDGGLSPDRLLAAVF